MKYKMLALFGLLILLAAQSLPTFGSTSGGAKMQDIELTAGDFAAGTGSGFAITADGLTLADGAMTAVYTSPIFDAPFAFNTAVPKWQAIVPELASMELNIRTRVSGGEWSQWYDIHENDDWTPEDVPFLVGDLLVAPPEDLVHRQFQFSVSFSRYAGVAAPILQQLTLTIMDTTDGPTTAELLEQQAALDAARLDDLQATNAYPRPTVISREVWCTSVDCDYTAGLEYSPATHMVVHHTVSANSATDWAAIVRAIWNYHTYSNGWGDVGYNYLIDRTGVIYEGHMNQDYLNLDVVGTHASAANVGSMGVALIGTFTTAAEYTVYDTPPQAMLNAAANLLAWKTDQRDIDVYSASRLVNMTWGLPHLMGHRDVYGGLSTLCPGGNAYNLLPYLRDQVAQRINFVSVYLYIDELSSAFTKSNNTWYEGPRGCGNNGHSYYTKNVNSASLIENWGEWRPNVPENGRYEIQVYAPYCNIGGPETNGAIYTITGADGTTTKTVSHQANVGLWMSLGEFNLNAGTGNLIRLTDLTSGDPTNYDYAVWFDAIRLRPLGSPTPTPTVTNQAPAGSSLISSPTVTFGWVSSEITDPLTSTLRVATDAGMSNVVLTKTVTGSATSTSHTFAQDYADLYWQVTVEFTPLQPGSANTATSAVTRFALDITPPSSQINKIYELATGDYFLGWQGSDAVSGIASYKVEYRMAGDTLWTALVTGTTAVSTSFTPPDPNLTYQFRVQATDNAGHVEAPHASPDIDTTQAVLLSQATMLPLISR